MNPYKKKRTSSKFCGIPKIFLMSMFYTIVFLLVVLDILSKKRALPSNVKSPATLLSEGSELLESVEKAITEDLELLEETVVELANSIPNNHKNNVVETFVISLTQQKFNQFLERNHEDLQNATWIVASNGKDQSTLDRFAEIGGLKEVLDASKSDPKDGYQSNSATGHYLSHWTIINMLQHRHPMVRPAAYLILEDAAQCIPNLSERILELVQQLPPDWEMLYVGGRPVTFYPDPLGKFNKDLSEDQVRQLACAGDFGKGSSPLAPDGSRSLATTQPYWRTTFMAETYAYVLNPHNLDRLHTILKPRQYLSIENLMGNQMRSGQIKHVYIPTTKWCANHPTTTTLSEPKAWIGWWMFQQDTDTGSSTDENSRFMEPIVTEGCQA